MHTSGHTKKVTISMETDALREIEKKAWTYGLSVSRFLQLAGLSFNVPLASIRGREADIHDH
jgi:hypothetical protein